VLFSLFELISQLDDVGKGSYQMADALAYVALTAPRRFIEMIPITALLAGVIAMGRLADSGELTAMRACGFSPMAIARGILLACLGISAAASAVGELAVPGLESRAAAIRLKTSTTRGVTFTGRGIWIKKGDCYVNVERLTGPQSGRDVSIFRFDASGRLKEFIHAERADLLPDRWILRQAAVKRLEGMAFSTSLKPQVELEALLKPKEMKALETPPEGLAARELLHYIHALQKSGQNPDHYLVVFWRKFSQPLLALGMALASVAFMLGSSARGTMGTRVALSILAGLILYFLDQISMQAGLLFGVSPAVVAFAPAALVYAAAFWRLMRLT